MTLIVENFRLVLNVCVGIVSEKRVSGAVRYARGSCTLKTHQMFSVHTTPGEFESATIAGHFGFVLEENSGREIK